MLLCVRECATRQANQHSVLLVAKALVEVMSCGWHIRYVDSRSVDLVADMRGEYYKTI